MYVFPAGSGVTGIPKLVKPGDELNFEEELPNSGECDVFIGNEDTYITQFTKFTSTQYSANSVMPIQCSIETVCSGGIST